MISKVGSNRWIVHHKEILYELGKFGYRSYEPAGYKCMATSTQKSLVTWYVVPGYRITIRDLENIVSYEGRGFIYTPAANKSRAIQISSSNSYDISTKTFIRRLKEDISAL